MYFDSEVYFLMLYWTQTKWRRPTLRNKIEAKSFKRNLKLYLHGASAQTQKCRIQKGKGDVSVSSSSCWFVSILHQIASISSLSAGFLPFVWVHFSFSPCTKEHLYCYLECRTFFYLFLINVVLYITIHAKCGNVILHQYSVSKIELSLILYFSSVWADFKMLVNTHMSHFVIWVAFTTVYWA